MSYALGSPSRRGFAPQPKAVHAPTTDTPTSVAVYALVGWLMCQVSLIVALPWLRDGELAFARLCVLTLGWLTFRRAYQLRSREDAVLGSCVVGFEWLLESWCGVPFSAGWALVALTWLVAELDAVSRHRLRAMFLDRAYALLCVLVYATTKTERLQSPHFGFASRTLAWGCESLRRTCARKLSRHPAHCYWRQQS